MSTVASTPGSSTPALPLDGLRVLDFTHAAAGPYATMFLGDMGADVIKVEKPGRGDGARYMGEPMLGPVDSDYYLALNRNKRSLLVDISVP
ncbi:MAG: CoA transferase, partial [Actinomycetota bacterium]|nr:CoA transferase [Actinomycetota bacterium]